MTYVPSAAATGPTLLGSESGLIPTTRTGILSIDAVDASETLRVTEATVAVAPGDPVPTGCDLHVATIANGVSTVQSTIHAGDGTTAALDLVGDPLASFSPASGTETVAIIVDNQTAGDLDIIADARGEIG